MGSSRGNDGGVDLSSELAYNALAVPGLWIGAQMGSIWNAKLRAGLAGRVGLMDRMRAQAERLQRCVWFHASSAGEYEQARPIIRALRAEAATRSVDLPTLMTSFSPSGVAHAAKNPESDYSDYLPLDTKGNASALIQLLRPRAIVFISFDCWPNTVWAARRAGVTLVHLNAHFHARSLRERWPARRFFRKLFDCFDHIGTVDDVDRERFVKLGVKTKIEVSGDSRIEQILRRFDQSASGKIHRHLLAQDYRYIALGSVWPADLDVILPPILDALDQDSSLGLIAVPHEPSASQLESLEKRICARGLASCRLSELIDSKTQEKIGTEPAEWRIILVDTVGSLAEIYRASIVSYVGGAFTTGVHNVIEPAVTGQPVLFGPRIHNATEAKRLCDLRAAMRTENQQQFRNALDLWLGDETAREDAGHAAREYVLGQTGATAKSLRILSPYVFDA